MATNFGQKRAIIRMKENQYINIAADRLVQDGDFIYIYLGEDELIGMCRTEEIVMAQLTDRTDSGPQKKEKATEKGTRGGNSSG